MTTTTSPLDYTDLLWPAWPLLVAAVIVVAGALLWMLLANRQQPRPGGWRLDQPGQPRREQERIPRIIDGPRPDPLIIDDIDFEPWPTYPKDRP